MKIHQMGNEVFHSDEQAAIRTK